MIKYLLYGAFNEKTSVKHSINVNDDRDDYDNDDNKGEGHLDFQLYFLICLSPKSVSGKNLVHGHIWCSFI